TPALAVPTLRAIVEAGHDVALVVSAADKRRGRGSALQPSPVKAAALELGLAVTDRIDEVLELDPPAQLGVVVAFGRLIKPHVEELQPFQHVGLDVLPDRGGAAAVDHA